jgi:hypothetical protein
MRPHRVDKDGALNSNHQSCAIDRGVLARIGQLLIPSKRIATVEGELAAAVGSRHPNVFQYIIDAAVQVEIRAGLRIR